jgi:hypothetical protein
MVIERDSMGFYFMVICIKCFFGYNGISWNLMGDNNGI